MRVAMVIMVAVAVPSVPVFMPVLVLGELGLVGMRVAAVCDL